MCADAAREELDDPYLAQVEVRRARRLEQHQHPEHALGALHDRAAEHLVRHARKRPAGGSDRWQSASAAAVESRRAAGDASASARPRPPAAACPLPVRHTAMLRSGITSAPTLQPRWSTQLCTSWAKSSGDPVRLVLRVAEQQLEVAVAHHEVALQLADVVLRRRARAAGSRAPDAAVRGPVRTVAARAAWWPRGRPRPRADQRYAVAIAQQEDVDAVLASIGCTRPVPCSVPVRSSADSDSSSNRCSSGTSTAVAHPHGHAHAIVDRNRLSARHQHA